MGAIVLPQQQDPFAQQLMALMAQSDARRAEKARLAQQQSQFEQTLGNETRLTDAQIAQANANAGTAGAITGKTKTETAATIIEPIKRDYDAILKNAGPEAAAKFVTGRLDAYKDNPEALQLLQAYATARPSLQQDETNQNIANYQRDVTGRVEAGGQNAIDVNTMMKLGTGEQLSAPAFGNQDTREFGPK